ncbi:MAG: hypothetical protein EBT45_08455 [Alphaproteobacteria bacterium]|nr:hypothetical protein [Alphaproteobacteria bacterium]
MVSLALKMPGKEFIVAGLTHAFLFELVRLALPVKGRTAGKKYFAKDRRHVHKDHGRNHFLFKDGQGVFKYTGEAIIECDKSSWSIVMTAQDLGGPHHLEIVFDPADLLLKNFWLNIEIKVPAEIAGEVTDIVIIKNSELVAQQLPCNSCHRSRATDRVAPVRQSYHF